MVRDPWFLPARERGLNSGSSYKVTLRTFLADWYAVGLYRE